MSGEPGVLLDTLKSMGDGMLRVAEYFFIIVIINVQMNAIFRAGES